MAAGFARATRDYYRWIERGWRARGLALDPEGLKRKRRKMEGTKRAPAGLFPFLRGSFYLWRGQFAAVAEAVRTAPELLGAGDVHLENFGTWRDAEGRLVWGVNDVDEAATLPFTADLVRLMTSFLAAARDTPKAFAMPAREAASSILQGYRDGLTDGTPFILENEALDIIRRAALAADDPAAAWAKLREDGAEEAPPDEALRHLLLTCLPQGARRPVFRRVQKGIGSLGRPRWAVVAEWNGGPVAREAKATAPSGWLLGDATASPMRDQRRLVAEARRAPDPGFVLTRDWVVRRISPEMRKIEMADLRRAGPGAEPGADPGAAQEALLRAMGGEVANLHAGTAPDRDALLAWLDAQDRAGAWLLEAALAAEQAVLAAQREFLAEPGVVEGA